MKTIDLTTVERPVEELLDLAETEGVLIRLPNGKVFLVTSVADESEDEEVFADEIARTRQNAALMELLKERSEEKSRSSAQEARKRLGID